MGRRSLARVRRHAKSLFVSPERVAEIGLGIVAMKLAERADELLDAALDNLRSGTTRNHATTRAEILRGDAYRAMLQERLRQELPRRAK